MTHLSTQPHFLSATAAARLIREHGLADAMAEMAEFIREDYLRWSSFEKSARVASHSVDGVIELMPISDGVTYGCKVVNGHPANARFGMPTVMAFGFLVDVLTGAPVFVSELTLTTALRTAATSALAARVLARPDSRTMALIGNGAQSEFQALAFQRILGISTLRLFDVDPMATAKLVRNLAGSGLEIVVCESTRDAVRGADIVTTVTADKRNATILTVDMIEAGMHINAVGGDCPGKTELESEILNRSKVFVEFEPQSRIEGEIQHMPDNFVVTEFWSVLADSSTGRENAEQITVFDSVGFALEDLSALRYMHDLAVRAGLAEELDLIARTEDPKDLFSFLEVPVAVPSGR